MIAFNAIHAEITWNLSDDGILTISGTNMPNHGPVDTGNHAPWYSQRSKIKTVLIEENMTNIGEWAFCNCFALTSVTIPNSVTSIGAAAFYNCSGLTSITIPNSVTSIGSSAFYACSGLKSITIPNSVTSIVGAFKKCSGLTSVTIPNSVTKFDGAFQGCSNLTSVTIPNSVTTIGGYAFDGCSSLTSITIPNSVTSILNNAFFNCRRLTSITIPNSVTWIGDYAFYGCEGLKSLTCEAIEPPKCNYNGNCFQGVNIYIPLYVPASSVNAYQNRVQWMDFPYILPISNTPTIALNLTDNTSDLIIGYYQKGEITYTRNNMSVGDYATFCLPFDIDLGKTINNFSKVYVPLNIGFIKPAGNLLILLEEVNSNSIIKAGQIFVTKCAKADVVFENCTTVMLDGTTTNPTPSNVKIYNFDGISGALTQKTDVKIKIGGTYSNLTNLSKNKYRALYANGSFNSTTSVNPFQMYVYIDGSSLASKVTSISFDFNDEATGIKVLKMTNDNSPIYNLNGQRINNSNAQKGVYIINGKKYAR